MPMLFAEGNPDKVQLLLEADTSGISHGVFECVGEGEFASKFNAFTEKLNFLFESRFGSGDNFQYTNWSEILYR